MKYKNIFSSFSQRTTGWRKNVWKDCLPIFWTSTQNPAGLYLNLKWIWVFEINLKELCNISSCASLTPSWSGETESEFYAQIMDKDIQWINEKMSCCECVCGNHVFRTVLIGNGEKISLPREKFWLKLIKKMLALNLKYFFA